MQYTLNKFAKLNDKYLISKNEPKEFINSKKGFYKRGPYY